MADPVTEEMRVEQLKRAAEERDRADRSELDPDTDTHERRATKAEYLKAKLDQRAEAERAARRDH